MAEAQSPLSRQNRNIACTGELMAEILLVNISSIIVTYVIYHLMLETVRIFRNTQKIFRDMHTNLLLSMIYALSLPLLSFLFSQAKDQKNKSKSQVFLIWMVFIEFVRIGGNPIYSWSLKKSAEQWPRLFWISFLVYSYALPAFRPSLFLVCVYFAIIKILKSVLFHMANKSYLIGKNPKLIHTRVKRIMRERALKTAPMNSCDYIVMGEDNYEITTCDAGYCLGEKKSYSQSELLTVGRVFQLNSTVDEAFTSAHPTWRDDCLAFALAKMLRRRFAKLPLDEARCKKAPMFVQQGLIDYIGKNTDIPMGESYRSERNPTERVFHIIQKELIFVAEFMRMRLPINHYFFYYDSIGVISMLIMGGTGIYLIWKVFWITSYISEDYVEDAQKEYGSECFFVKSKFLLVWVNLVFSWLDRIITSLLVIASAYIYLIQTFGISERWNNLAFVRYFIRDPARWYQRYRSRQKSILGKLYLAILRLVSKPRGEHFKQAKAHSSVFDTKPVTILFYIKVDWSIPGCVPKWIRRYLLIRASAVLHSTNTKEAILRSLGNCIKKSLGNVNNETSPGYRGVQLTNGETAPKDHGMEHLNKETWMPNGSTIEAILVWHIATTLFHHDDPSSPPQNEQRIALELSGYCHYLLVYYPELLPDEVEWTQTTYKHVKNDISILDACSNQKRPSKMDRCTHALQSMPAIKTNSLVIKGANLAKELQRCNAEGKQVWEMLADFWVEMMLFIAPSDNLEAHEQLLERGELITQLWALLTHAGIVTRPEHVEHHGHESENNVV